MKRRWMLFLLSLLLSPLILSVGCLGGLPLGARGVSDQKQVDVRFETDDGLTHTTCRITVDASSSAGRVIAIEEDEHYRLGAEGVRQTWDVGFHIACSNSLTFFTWDNLILGRNIIPGTNLIAEPSFVDIDLLQSEVSLFDEEFEHRVFFSGGVHPNLRGVPFPFTSTFFRLGPPVGVSGRWMARDNPPEEGEGRPLPQVRPIVCGFDAIVLGCRVLILDFFEESEQEG